MKSLSNFSIHRSSDGSATIARVSSLHDKHINAARKFITEFVDIDGYVGIIRSSVGGAWLHALQLLQSFGETRERPCGTRGTACTARVRAHYLDRGKFVAGSFTAGGSPCGGGT